MKPADPLLIPLWTPSPPVADGVDLFLFDLDHSPAHHDLKPHLRRRAVGRRILLHLLAGRLAAPVESIELARTPAGKPILVCPQSPLAFNVSYTRRWLAAALAPAGRIGIDVETLNPAIEALDIARHHFHPHELAHLQSLAPADRPLAFHRYWTAKEAILKALGTGLSLDPRQIEITLEPVPHLQTGGYDMDLDQWQIPLGPEILILTLARHRPLESAGMATMPQSI